MATNFQMENVPFYPNCFRSAPTKRPGSQLGSQASLESVGERAGWKRMCVDNKIWTSPSRRENRSEKVVSERQVKYQWASVFLAFDEVLVRLEAVSYEEICLIRNRALVHVLFRLFSRQCFQDAIAKSGRSPPDPHVPPFAMFELGVMYARDKRVRTRCC